MVHIDQDKYIFIMYIIFLITGMYIYILGSCRVVHLHKKIKTKYKFRRNIFLINTIWEHKIVLDLTHRKITQDMVDATKFIERLSAIKLKSYVNEKIRIHNDLLRKANFVIIELSSIKHDKDIYTYEEFKENIDYMLNYLNQKSKIIFVSHINVKSDRINSKIKLRILLEQFIEKYIIDKKNIYFFKPSNMFENCDDPKSYAKYFRKRDNFLDLNHYSEEGYKLFGKHIEQFINNIINSK